MGNREQRGWEPGDRHGSLRSISPPLFAAGPALPCALALITARHRDTYILILSSQ